MGMEEVAKQLSKQAQESKKIQNEMLVREYLSNFINLSSEIHKQSTSYTNIVIIAGYAAFFTIFSNYSSEMEHQIKIYIGFSMSISCLIFILWEIYRMIRFSLHSRNTAAVIDNISNIAKKGDINGAIKKFGEYNTNIQKQELIMWEIWPFQLSASLLSGLFSISLLFYYFITELYNS